MALIVNHNIPALQAYNAVNATSSSLEKSIAKLSTGLRINSAADDAAGLAISEKMRAQVRGLDRAISNSQDGISMLQTAEGALSETHSILQRMRELSVQSANDTLTQQDRAYIQLEIDELREEISRIGNTTQFNKKKLLDGSAAVLWSSNTLSTRAIVNGGLRSVDAFGQKTTAEGNFVIDINADPGKAQVQKTDIFTIKHPDVVMNVSTNAEFGINGVAVNNVPAGDYQIQLGTVSTASTGNSPELEKLKTSFENYTDSDYEVTLTFDHYNETSGNATFKVEVNGLDGALPNDFHSSATAIELSSSGWSSQEIGIQGSKDRGLFEPLNITIARNTVDFSGLEKGDEITYKVKAGTYTATTGSITWTTTDTGTTVSGISGVNLKLTPTGTTANQGPSYIVFDVKAITTGLAGDYEISGDFGNGFEKFLVNTTSSTFTASTGVEYYVDLTGVSADNVGDSAKFILEGVKSKAVDNISVTGTAWTTPLGNSGFTVITNNAVLDGDLSIEFLNTGAVNSAGMATTDLTVKVTLENVTLGSSSVGAGTYGPFVATGTVSAGTNTLSIKLSDPNETSFDFQFRWSTTAGAEIHADDILEFNFTKPTINTGSTWEVAPSTRLRSTEAVGHYGTTGADNKIKVDGSQADKNASILLEVTAVNDVTGAVTFKATSNVLKTDGSVLTRVENIILNKNILDISTLLGDDKNKGTLRASLYDIAANGSGTSADNDASKFFKVGDKLAYNVVANVDDDKSFVNFQIKGKQTEGWPDGWRSKDNSVTYENRSLGYTLSNSASAGVTVNGQEVHFRNFYINEEDGTVYTGDIVLSLDKDFSTKIKKAKSEDTLASFTAAYVGQVAESDVKLGDLDKFWNSEGRFLLKDAQTLTITQGDGTKASVTLYATDTLEDAAVKLNAAIAKQLGQSRLLSTVDNDAAANQFVTYVGSKDKKDGTSESVTGTFVIRSAIAGGNGEISFAGDEELLNKLSLNEIQVASENTFTVSVWDAHSGKSVASSVKITGNKLIGVVDENVDVVFDAMANIKVEWNDATRSFTLRKEENSYQTTLHLADNTTVFQIGANEGEDMGINIGDMRAEALGLNAVLVTDREAAARSITIIDNAIDKVSMQRAKLGAYQNRLEHTITNLTTAGENLTAAESRIRDVDMAKEMMNFTKLQIMLQAGTSMLAQANTLPQNVLSLLR
jgi:flagellin-like hook-associated protein FlgL